MILDLIKFGGSNVPGGNILLGGVSVTSVTLLHRSDNSTFSFTFSYSHSVICFP